MNVVTLWYEVPFAETWPFAGADRMVEQFLTVTKWRLQLLGVFDVRHRIKRQERRVLTDRNIIRAYLVQRRPLMFTCSALASTHA